ncbi:rho guanine nucleotide exchange factor 7 isoform X2 [Cimex lectularius]|uniref:Rho guanine nucleotide exchange factor 7 n=1 Tax=Cimex lectularius TaxID=79782 RepID=A0A8I6RVR5_CIMLE|nr:rho guanine nucleotide exchange factor 7 isoform X2 [Cimex lectularius]
MGVEGQPFLVQAIYSFKGQNNDELCFKKGDIITVTQEEEGGWWEGTLGEKTGWFPSNYVKEYIVQTDNLSPLKTSNDITVQQRAYRTVVIKDLVDSERSFISDLQQLISSILFPLEKAHVLSKEEFNEVIGNLKEVVSLHETLLCNVETALVKSPNEQRVGKVMLLMAPRFKQTHQTYCNGHPSAAFVINKHKDKLSAYLQQLGENGQQSSILVLTSGLSKPFRRLERYSNHLQELERHLEESHPDRGDTQRAAAVFKEIAVSCSLIRRQKEMELDITTGGVRGWEGQDIAKLGSIIHMGSVAVGPDHKDRYLVLFPTTLLMLSTSHRMSAFIYEGKLPLTGIKVNKLEDTENYKNAFEIVGCLIERILAICQTKEDQQKWVELITKQCEVIGAKSSHIQRASEIVVDANLEGPWSISCLRPSAPCRSSLLKSDKPPPKSEKSFEEDAEILRVIESYCTTANSRFTLNSDILDGNFKPLVEKNNMGNSEDLSGTVTELREQIQLIQNELHTLRGDVRDEKSAREQLQALLNTKVNSVKSVNELVITE